jgi:hypothetical protein
MIAFKNLCREAALAALLAWKVGAVDNGLAITPQMGCEFSPGFFFENITDQKQGIIGMPLGATSRKLSSSKPRSSLSIMGSKT